MRCCGLVLISVGAGSFASLAVSAAAAAAETEASPAAGPPASKIGRSFDPATAPFIPIPEIDIAPNSGLTLGVIPTVLRTNARNEIETIIAPDIIHSEYFGWGSRARVFSYPSDDTQWSVVAGLKQHVEREFDATYATGQTRRDRYTWSVEAIYDRSGTSRFFGIGNDTLQSSETSYVNNQSRLEATIGRNFTRAWQLSYLLRLRAVDVLSSALPSLPSTGTVYPDLVGVGAEHELQQRLTLIYDTRDSTTVARDGARYALYGGFVSRDLGSSVTYNYIGADARRYWPLSADVAVALHAALRYMPSAGEAPFWALSSLGGDRSVLAERAPLRAYGEDRFIDRNMFASGIELRRRVAAMDAFTTRISIELAPFFDVGKVFSSTGESLLSELHHSAGLGIRAIASPYIVGYVDIGYGHEGTAVFSGLNYPF